MTIKQEYFQLLEHVGPTVPLVELSRSPAAADLVALRHDVAHDLDLALEMASYEYKLGARATYYLLHTANYVQDNYFVDKCLQLQDYGHEVGLHLNALTPWFEGKSDDPIGDLEAWLLRLRAAGVIINGSSAHVDRACYKYNFINYWIWSDLRSDDPAISEAGLAAEGVPMGSIDQRVSYPASHRLTRGDGVAFPLWSVPMGSLGISYEATRVLHDQYWSDCGGSWKQGLDPLDHNLSRGHHQLLTCPESWRDSQRIVFVVSTARSGSRWLTEQFHRASSADARHEWSLNTGSDVPGEHVGKRTSCDLRYLENHPAEVERLLGVAIRKIRCAKRDFVECNVYLTPWIEVLKRLCPEAEFVHLHREHPYVIRSLIGRNWYASFDDRNRPTVDVESWVEASRFQRVCHYWADVNRHIIQHVPEGNRIGASALFGNKSAFENLVKKLGFVVHSRLLRDGYAKALNQTDEPTVEPVASWPDDIRSEMDVICNATAKLLASGIVDAPRVSGDLGYVHRVGKSINVKVGRGSGHEAKVVYRLSPEHGLIRKIVPIVKSKLGCTGPNAHICLLRGMSWRQLRAVSASPLEAGATCLLDIEYAIQDSSSPVRMFVLCFDASGEVIDRVQVAEFFFTREKCSGSAFLPAGTCQVGLAVHIGCQHAGFTLKLLQVDCQVVWNPEGYGDACNALMLG